MKEEIEELRQVMGVHQQQTQEGLSRTQSGFDRANQLEEQRIQDVKDLAQTVALHSGKINQVNKKIDDVAASIPEKMQEERFNEIMKTFDNVNDRFEYFQDFIDQQAIDQVKLIKLREASPNIKFMAFEWLARYVDFPRAHNLTKNANSF